MPKPINAGNTGEGSSKNALQGYIERTKSTAVRLGLGPSTIDSIEQLRAAWEKAPKRIFEIDPSWIDFEDKTFTTRPDLRPDSPEVNSVVAGFQETGQNSPALLRWVSNNRIQIYDGWCRSFAAQRLGIRVKATLDEIEESAAHVKKAQANYVRNNNTDYETILSIQKHVELGYDVAKIAKDFNRSEPLIYQLLAVAKQPTLVDGLRDKKINGAFARFVASKIKPAGLSQEQISFLVEYFSKHAVPKKDFERVLSSVEGLISGLVVLHEPALADSEVSTLEEESLEDHPAHGGDGGAKTTSPSAPTSSKGGHGSADKSSQKKSLSPKAFTFNEKTGAFSFTVRVVPGKVTVKQLLALKDEAVQFQEALRKIIRKEGKA